MQGALHVGGGGGDGKCQGPQASCGTERVNQVNPCPTEFPHTCLGHLSHNDSTHYLNFCTRTEPAAAGTCSARDGQGGAAADACQQHGATLCLENADTCKWEPPECDFSTQKESAQYPPAVACLLPSDMPRLSSALCTGSDIDSTTCANRKSLGCAWNGEASGCDIERYNYASASTYYDGWAIQGKGDDIGTEINMSTLALCPSDSLLCTVPSDASTRAVSSDMCKLQCNMTPGCNAVHVSGGTCKGYASVRPSAVGAAQPDNEIFVRSTYHHEPPSARRRWTPPWRRTQTRQLAGRPATQRGAPARATS